MKRLLHVVMLLSMVGSNFMFANSSEFRTSLQRLRRGVIHYPLADVEDSWWYESMPEQADDCKTWQLDTWGIGWRMVASAAFDAREDGSTSKTTSLSQLWFGRDTFRGEEVFAGGMINDPILLTQTNPFLGFARISPSFDYNEHGVFFGITFRQAFGEDECWHIGFRASMPVIEIEIEQDSSCGLEEVLADVVQRIPINLDADGDPNQVDYAYRLDLLSSLARPVNELVSSDLIPVVQYGNGDGNVLNATYIGGVLVANTTAQGNVFPGTEVAFPAAYVTRSNGTILADRLANACGDCDNRHFCDNDCGSFLSDDGFVTGQIPSYPFRRTAAQVTGQLAADGSGGGDGSTSFFQITGQNYAANLALDREAQGELFVVPRLNPDTTPPRLFQSAVAIDQAVQSILQFIDPSQTATQFFLSRGIDFCALDHTVGVGDLYTEFSIGLGNYKDWFGDFLFGLLFPTGTSEGSANHIYHKPTGNNRHVEIKLGLEGGWQPFCWFAFRGDASFNHAFKRRECRALPFDQTSLIIRPSGSNDCPCDERFFVRNIGEGREFDISWNYFVGHIDFTFFHPYNPELGCVIGYELFAKGHDHVSFICDDACDDCVCVNGVPAIPASVLVATDLLGRTNQRLNLEVLEQNTNSMTHKIYGDLFHRWNFFELFGGASQIVGGKHAMQETEAHIGMRIFF